MAGVLQTLVAASFCWFLASSLWIYPHSLSYFNESIGGPVNGPEHLLGSNVDWGQDLLYVNMIAERSSRPIALAYFGPLNPKVLGPLKSSEPVVPQRATLAFNLLTVPPNLDEMPVVISLSLAYGRLDFARCGSSPKYRIPSSLLESICAERTLDSLGYSLRAFEPRIDIGETQ